MRSIAVILVSLLSLAPLYSLALPTLHGNATHHAGGVTKMTNCSHAHHQKHYVRNGKHCVEIGGVGFQLATETKSKSKSKSKGLSSYGTCMPIEKAKEHESPGMCWIAKDSGSGARKPTALTGSKGHVQSKVGKVKGHRSYRRTPVGESIPPPGPIRPLPPTPAQSRPPPQAPAQPVTQPRPLPHIPAAARPPPQAPAQLVAQPRPLPQIPAPAQPVAQPRPNGPVNRIQRPKPGRQ